MSVAAAALFAALAVTADCERHRVTFTARPSGVSAGTTVEFLAVGPSSEKSYESLFVTDAPLDAIRRAFDRAGIPRGLPPDARSYRYWPLGPSLEISPDPAAFVTATRGGAVTKFVRVAGRERAADPLAVAALYDCPTAAILADGALEQSATYGRFVAAGAAGTNSIAFTVSWSGSSNAAPYRLALAPGSLAESFAKLRQSSAESTLDVLADFSDRLTVAEARSAAKALDVIDGERCRLNGCVDGQFFYRAFLPDESWRDRLRRPAQPLEVRLDAPEGPSFTVIDEVWSETNPAPALVERRLGAEEAARACRSSTVFIYAPDEMQLGALYAVRQRLALANANIRLWYVMRSEK